MSSPFALHPAIRDPLKNRSSPKGRRTPVLIPLVSNMRSGNAPEHTFDTASGGASSGGQGACRPSAHPSAAAPTLLETTGTACRSHPPLGGPRWPRELGSFGGRVVGRRPITLMKEGTMIYILCRCASCRHTAKEEFGLRTGLLWQQEGVRLCRVPNAIVREDTPEPSSNHWRDCILTTHYGKRR